MGRNLESEEYPFGSSDYPITSPALHMRFAGHRFESRWACVSIRLLNPDGTVNVEATNSRRLELIRKKRLSPIIMDKGVTYYRYVSRDSLGVISLEYKPLLPSQLESLFPNETISYAAAAKYLNVPKYRVNRLARDGEIKALRGRVILADLNRHKRER